MDSLEFRLINEFQRDFPFEPRPFAEIAWRLCTDEESVLAALQRLRDEGVVSRVGAVFSPRRVGASTLAALAAPPERLEEIAAASAPAPRSTTITSASTISTCGSSSPRPMKRILPVRSARSSGTAAAP